MPHRSLLVLLVAAIATLNVLTGAAQGQTPPPTPLTYEWVITTTWKDIHDKILEMAKDTVFPDDKLEWRPHPDARSVLEEFRQVTNGLEWSSAQLRGEKLDGAAVMRAPEGRRRQAEDARFDRQRDGSRNRDLVSARGKVSHAGAHRLDP